MDQKNSAGGGLEKANVRPCGGICTCQKKSTITESADRIFLDHYLDVEQCKPWLERCKNDPKKAYCNVCKRSFGAMFQTIVEHGMGKKHLKKLGITTELKRIDFKLPRRVKSDHDSQIAKADVQSTSVPLHNVPDVIDKNKVMDPSAVETSQRQKDSTKEESANRTFLNHYLDVEQCKPWLEKCENDLTKAYCNVCKRTFGAMFSTIVEHGMGKKHLKKLGITMELTKTDFKLPCGVNSDHDRKIAKAELQYAGMSCQTGLAFLNVPVVLDYNKAIDPTGPWKSMHLGRTKTRDLAVNVIMKCVKENLARILRTNFFSICVDESTDVSKQKSLAIIVRYNDPDTKQIQCEIWDIHPIFEKGKKAKATAARIFSCIEESFAAYDIPLTNIITCCTDGCNTMIGEISGLKARMVEAIPGLIYIQCAAHNIHLCAKHAYEELCPEVIALYEDINALCNSAHKLHDFSEFQREYCVLEHKLLKRCLSRWLSMGACTDRIIDQYDPLLAISFELSNGSKKDKVAGRVFEALSNNNVKCSLLLLQRVLRELNALNCFYQTKGVVIHVASARTEKAFKNIVSIILDRKYVNSTSASEINIFDEKNYLRFVDFEVADKVTVASLFNRRKVKDFCRRTYNFVISLAMQMKQRFHNFTDPILQAVACLRAVNVTSAKYRIENPSVFTELLLIYKKLWDGTESSLLRLERDWERLFHVNIPKHLLEDDNVEAFWFYLYSFDENGNSQLNFQEISLLALTILTSAHANADPERTFSDVTYSKNKYRNCLGQSSTAGV